MVGAALVAVLGTGAILWLKDRASSEPAESSSVSRNASSQPLTRADEPPAVAPRPSRLAAAESSPPAAVELPESVDQEVPTGLALRADVEALENEAIEAVKQLTEALPASPDPLALMGMVQVRFGNIAEGMAWWQRCLDADPKRVDVLDGMAEVAAEKGELDKAAQLWSQVLQTKPASRGTRNKLGRVLIDSGKLEEAVAALEEELTVSPEQKRLSYFLMGKAYLQLQEFEKARESYETAVEIQPDYTGAWYGLATAHARLGQSEQARHAMEKFQTVKAADRDAETGRKRSRKDLASIRRLVARAHTEVGVTYQRSGFLHRAEQHWVRAAELDPQDGSCRLMLASLYRDGRKYEKALPICEQLVQIDPANAALHVNLAFIYSRMSRTGDALAQIQRAIDLEPDRAEYRRIYQQIKNPSQN